MAPRFLVRARGSVYAVAGQGIGNRLKHLASACAAAAYYGHRACGWWLHDDGLDCDWERLFASVPLELREGPPPLGLWRLRAGAWLWLPADEGYPDAGEYPDRRFGGRCVGRPAAGAVRLTIPREIPAGVQDRYRAIFAGFRPRDEILQHVGRVAGELGLEACIGVHVRKTDMEQGMQQHFPGGSPYEDAAYFASMDGHLARARDVRFFVVSDSPEALERFRRRYGARLLTSGEIPRGRVGSRAVIAALQDLLFLSRTTHIVGSYKSSFSEMAWWWGRATLEIVGLDEPAPPR
jgi:hypothetical protein